MTKFRFLLLFIFSFLSLIHQSFSAAEADEEIPYKMGLLRSPHDATQRLGASDLLAAPGYAKKLPSQWSLARLFEDKPIYDQGPLGSCTAHSVANALWGRSHELGLQPFAISRLFTYYNSRKEMGAEYIHQDCGASLYHVLLSLKHEGYCHEELWPYEDVMKKYTAHPPQSTYSDGTSHKVLDDMGIAWVGTELDSIKLALKNNIPLAFGMTIYRSFSRVGPDGQVPFPVRGEKCLGGHAMAIVGYDDHQQALRIRNSWGPDWGNRGEAWLPYDMVGFISESWGIHRVTEAPEAEALFEGMALVPSQSTVPQKDVDLEELAKKLAGTL